MMRRYYKGACRVRNNIRSVSLVAGGFVFSIVLLYTLVATKIIVRCYAFSVNQRFNLNNDGHRLQHTSLRKPRARALFYRWPLWVELEVPMRVSLRNKGGASRKVQFVNSTNNNPITLYSEGENHIYYDDFKLNGDSSNRDSANESSPNVYSINNESLSDGSSVLLELAGEQNSSEAKDTLATEGEKNSSEAKDVLAIEGRETAASRNGTKPNASSSIPQPSFAKSLLSAASSLSNTSSLASAAASLFSSGDAEAKSKKAVDEKLKKNASSIKKQEAKQPPNNFFAPPKLSQPSWNISEYYNMISESSNIAANTITNTPVVTWITNNSNANTNKDDATISLTDLESYLAANGYVRQSDLVDSDSDPNGISSNSDTTKNSTVVGSKRSSANPDMKKNPQSLLTSSKTQSSDSSSSLSPSLSSSSKKTAGVAFPQPSELSQKSVQRASTVAATFMGIIIGVTVLPNLWLMGGILMAIYGYDITKQLPGDDDEPRNIVAKAIISCGRILAKEYLKKYDFVKGLWFMYKTGQLSYEYWKQYAALDERFAIQNKIDAWNARFQEGKIAFDEWEKENEIGRKVLATLRTVWLIEEQSLKKNRLKLLKTSSKTSRYRFVQYYYNTKYWFSRRIMFLFRTITGVLGGWSNKGFREFMQGIRMNMMMVSSNGSRSSELTKRVGAVGAAMVFVYITGALFAIAPISLTILSVLLGVIWPSWFGEVLQRFSTFVDETKAKGRGEDFPNNSLVHDDDDDSGDEYDSSRRKKMKRQADRVLIAVSSPFQKLRYTNSVDKDQFHFYVRQDGSKRYYRTGKPIFSSVMKQKTKLSKKKEKEAHDDFLGLIFNNNKGNNRSSNKHNKKNKKNDNFDLFAIFGGAGGGSSKNRGVPNRAKKEAYAFSWPWE